MVVAKVDTLSFEIGVDGVVDTTAAGIVIVMTGIS
jgi:hypothetical protein